MKTVAFVILMSLAGVAEAALPAAKEFDLDKDGTLNPAEQKAFARSRNETYAALDGNRDGEISDNEMQTFKGMVDKKFAEGTLLDLQDAQAANGSVAVAEAERIGSLPTKPKREPWPILVRRTHELQSIIASTGQQREQEKQKDAGVLIGFEDNDEKKSESTTLRGTLIYPVVFKTLPTSDPTHYDTLAVLTSLTFDKVNIDSKNTTVKSGVTDSLILRGGIELESLRPRRLSNQYWRANLAYATDFDVRSDVPTVELQWEPVAPTLAIGAKRSLFGSPVDFRLRTIAHAEAGRISDPGDNAKLIAAKAKSDSFVRAGGITVLEMWTDAIPSLGFKGRWQHLWGLEGDPDTFDYWDLGLSHALDEEKRTALEVSYREGLTPLKLEPVQNVTIGITVKY